MAVPDSTFEPIRIRFDGLDANRHVIEMTDLSVSLDGFSRILSTAAQYAATHQYVQRGDFRQFRAFVMEAPDPQCYEIVAMIGAVMQPPVIAPMFNIAKPLYEALVAWIFSHYKKDDAAVKALEAVALKALEEMGSTARHENEKQMEVMRELVAGMRDAVQHAVRPVGRTCNQLTIAPTAQVVNNIVINVNDREIIDEQEPETVLASDQYRVYLSEIDIQTRGCRVSFDDHMEGRIRGEITDPVLTNAGDPYTTAMNARQMIAVIAKAIVGQDGQVRKLVISDTA